VLIQQCYALECAEFRAITGTAEQLKYKHVKDGFVVASNLARYRIEVVVSARTQQRSSLTKELLMTCMHYSVHITCLISAV
jgi:hypothetical protein